MHRCFLHRNLTNNCSQSQNNQHIQDIAAHHVANGDVGGALQDARFAVIGRLVRDGESEEIDTSLVKANDNVRYPQLYYNVFGGSNPWVNASKWVPEAE